ncbi:MAG TPA: rhomboid family intramembrane serine protease [Vicinamibacterales bacterium]|nr:rhomboid family intramembrane serine protease [Vicinamibacterales bacterium]
MTLLFVLIVVGSYAIYVMTPDERTRALRTIEDRLWPVRDAVDKARAEDAPFRQALRARTPKPIAIPAIVAVSVFVFVAMALGGGSFSSAETLVGWGASFGPRTSNGEWWRLATALFVHAGFFHVLIETVALVQTGIMLERMLGRFAVVATFLSAGVLANVQHLSTYPIGIATGASGAVFGIYGLLGAAVTWGILARRSSDVVELGNLRADAAVTVPSTFALLQEASTPADGAEETAATGPITIPLHTIKRIVPVFALFVLYNAVAGTLDASALAGLLGGFLAGLVFARHGAVQTTPTMHVAAALGATAVIVIASAAMLHGIADVRPEIARVVALEDHTASVYEKAVNQFKNGAMSGKALAKLINQTIMPELQAAHAHLKSVHGVPAEHQPLVANADEYFRLRGESWRLRADALNKSNMVALRAAERSERASLEALERIRSAPVESRP